MFSLRSAIAVPCIPAGAAPTTSVAIHCGSAHVAIAVNYHCRVRGYVVAAHRTRHVHVRLDYSFSRRDATRTRSATRIAVSRAAICIGSRTASATITAAYQETGSRKRYPQS